MVLRKILVSFYQIFLIVSNIVISIASKDLHLSKTRLGSDTFLLEHARPSLVGCRFVDELARSKQFLALHRSQKQISSTL